MVPLVLKMSCLDESRLLSCFRKRSTPRSSSAKPQAMLYQFPSKLPSSPVPKMLTRQSQRAKAVRMQEAAPAPAVDQPAVVMSEALPFLTRRDSLGPVGVYQGDAGFDPIGWTEVFGMRWLREAEIKHGRVSMLAFVGLMFTDFYHLPGFDYSGIEAHDAQVINGGMSQMLLWLGLLEIFGAVGIDQMLRDSGREPGDFGFDPLGFSSTPEKLKIMQKREIKNGRLAMLAFSGAITQAVLSNNGFPWLYGDGTFPFTVEG